MTLLAALEILPVFIFALTGALAASRAQLDIVGLLLIAMTCSAAVLVFFTAHLPESRRRATDGRDAGALQVVVRSGFGGAMSPGHG